MAALLMQGKRRWKGRDDAMHQPACAHISGDYLHSRASKTRRIHSGTRTGKGACTGLSEHVGLARRVVLVHPRAPFHSPGAADATSHILQGSPLEGRRRITSHGVARPGTNPLCSTRRAARSRDGFSLALPGSDNFACLHFSLSCISQRDGILSFSFLCSRAQAIKNKG